MEKDAKLKIPSYLVINAKDITNTLVRGMELSKQAMIEEGLWNENTTFEEWSQYAGSHIIINEL